MTKGRAEQETPANVNMDYFLGIDAATGVLVGDFEDSADGTNHPVSGTTTVTTNAWHHAAATYDGTTWRLYLDGVLDRSLVVGAFNPEATSLQHAAIGSALTSTGVAAGFFAGTIDEVRIWSVARTGAQIRAGRDDEIGGPTAGLLGRWGLDEGAGHDRRQQRRADQRDAHERPDLGQPATASPRTPRRRPSRPA